MLQRRLQNFDIRQIAESGQCFRMTPLSEYCYRVISGCHCLILRQEGENCFFSCEESDFPYWETYFDLQADYAAYISSIRPDDKYLLQAAKSGSGIRILRQDTWEMMITFVISQQKTIPKIRELVEALCRQYGTKFPVPDPAADCEPYFYTFPTPEQLSQASLDDLLALKLGYRAKYIKRICEDACCGRLNLPHLTTLDYAAALEYLQEFFGIGEKVANCICLFGLHHIDAFPVDTWIKKILLREYFLSEGDRKSTPQTQLYNRLIQENFSCYPGYAGVMQQYIFYYERVVMEGKKSF